MVIVQVILCWIKTSKGLGRRLGRAEILVTHFQQRFRALSSLFCLFFLIVHMVKVDYYLGKELLKEISSLKQDCGVFSRRYPAGPWERRLRGVSGLLTANSKVQDRGKG